jgi:hypothetical protein
MAASRGFKGFEEPPHLLEAFGRSEAQALVDLSNVHARGDLFEDLVLPATLLHRIVPPVLLPGPRGQQNTRPIRAAQINDTMKPLDPAPFLGRSDATNLSPGAA